MVVAVVVASAESAESALFSPRSRKLHLGPQAQVGTHGPAGQRAGPNRVRSPRQVLARRLVHLTAHYSLGGPGPRKLVHPSPDVIDGRALSANPSSYSAPDRDATSHDGRLSRRVPTLPPTLVVVRVERGRCP